MEAMVTWHNERYLDPEVWDNLRDKVNPTLMPAPSVLNIEKRKHCQLHCQVRFLKLILLTRIGTFGRKHPWIVCVTHTVSYGCIDL